MSTLTSRPVPEEVISAVSNALRSFICKYVPRLASEESIVFDSPAAYDGTNENRLLLYLYQIEFNPQLRNAPPTLSSERAAMPYASLRMTPAPLAVDLLYMIVAYGQSYEYEQMIGGSVVGLLDRCGQIPPEFVTSPSLMDSGNSALPVVPLPATIHMLRDLWAGFPNKAYHLTKLYMISPVRMPAPSRLVDMVVHTEVVAGITDTRDRPTAGNP